MQLPRLTRSRDLACPDVQAVGLLAMQLQLLETLLHPFQLGELLLSGEDADLRMFQSIAENGGGKLDHGSGGIVLLRAA